MKARLERENRTRMERYVWKAEKGVHESASGKGIFMKGLMIKDFRLLKNQGNSFLIMAACGFIMTFTMANGMAIGYMTLLGAMLCLSTLGYDEFEGGYTYLFSLPVTRKSYVREKYVFCLLGAVAGAVFGMVLCPVVSVIKGEAGVADIRGMILTGGIACCVVSAFMLGIMIPVRLKFGNEKSRIVLFLVFALIGGGAFFVSSMRSAFPKELSVKLAAFGAKLNGGSVLLLVFLVCAGLLLLSEQISERILEKKEY